jgi:hypothetical protein
MRSIIYLASIMHGVDYWANGRTVDKLGIAGMSVKDIRFLVVGAETRPPELRSGDSPVIAHPTLVGKGSSGGP